MKDIETDELPCMHIYEGLLQPVANPTMLWEEIAMDFIVELPKSGGNTLIWTIVDLFSKQAHFIPCPKLPSAPGLSKNVHATHLQAAQGHKASYLRPRGTFHC